jgi:hypothetical protein
MTYSDDLAVHAAVALWMLDRMPHPWCPLGVTAPRPMTRADVIAAVLDQFGAEAAGSVRVRVH